MLFIEKQGPERGSVVVLLSGSPVAPAHFTPLATRLAPTYRTWNVHLPGYGTSAPLVPYDLVETNRLIEDALLAEGVNSAHFLGFSGGVYRAFTLAARRRVPLRSLVSLGGLIGLTKDQRASFRQLAQLVATGVDLSAQLPPAMLSPAGQNNPAWVAEVRTWGTAASAESLADEWNALAASPLADVTTFTAPILARVGDLDLACPPWRTEEIARYAPNVEAHVVPGSGHALLLEDFEATATAIEAFLARIEATKA